jgi:hypothetical protein
MRMFLPIGLMLAVAGCGHHEAQDEQKPADQVRGSSEPTAEWLAEREREEREYHDEVRQEIIKLIPVGTPIDQAEARITQKAFICSRQRDKQTGEPFLYGGRPGCDLSMTTSAHAFVYHEGRKVKRVNVYFGGERPEF